MCVFCPHHWASVFAMDPSQRLNGSGNNADNMFDLADTTPSIGNFSSGILSGLGNVWSTGYELSRSPSFSAVDPLPVSMSKLYSDDDEDDDDEDNDGDDGDDRSELPSTDLSHLTLSLPGPRTTPTGVHWAENKLVSPPCTEEVAAQYPVNLTITSESTNIDIDTASAAICTTRAAEAASACTQEKSKDNCEIGSLDFPLGSDQTRRQVELRPAEEGYDKELAVLILQKCATKPDPFATKDKKSGHVSCHQCKTSKSPSQLLFCTAAASGIKRRRCRKKYCFYCLQRVYSMYDVIVKPRVEDWNCPSCLGVCSCAGCKRKYREYNARLVEEAATHAKKEDTNAPEETKAEGDNHGAMEEVTDKSTSGEHQTTARNSGAFSSSTRLKSESVSPTSSPGAGTAFSTGPPSAPAPPPFPIDGGKEFCGGDNPHRDTGGRVDKQEMEHYRRSSSVLSLEKGVGQLGFNSPLNNHREPPRNGNEGDAMDAGNPYNSESVSGRMERRDFNNDFHDDDDDSSDDDEIDDEVKKVLQGRGSFFAAPSEHDQWNTDSHNQGSYSPQPQIYEHQRQHQHRYEPNNRSKSVMCTRHGSLDRTLLGYSSPVVKKEPGTRQQYHDYPHRTRVDNADGHRHSASQHRNHFHPSRSGRASTGGMRAASATSFASAVNDGMGMNITGAAHAQGRAMKREETATRCHGQRYQHGAGQARIHRSVSAAGVPRPPADGWNAGFQSHGNLGSDAYNVGRNVNISTGNVNDVTFLQTQKVSHNPSIPASSLMVASIARPAFSSSASGTHLPAVNHSSRHHQYSHQAERSASGFGHLGLKHGTHQQSGQHNCVDLDSPFMQQRRLSLNNSRSNANSHSSLIRSLYRPPYRSRESEELGHYRSSSRSGLGLAEGSDGGTLSLENMDIKPTKRRAVSRPGSRMSSDGQEILQDSPVATPVFAQRQQFSTSRSSSRCTSGDNYPGFKRGRDFDEDAFDLDVDVDAKSHDTGASQDTFHAEMCAVLGAGSTINHANADNSSTVERDVLANTIASETTATVTVPASAVDRTAKTYQTNGGRGRSVNIKMNTLLSTAVNDTIDGSSGATTGIDVVNRKGDERAQMVDPQSQSPIVRVEEEEREEQQYFLSDNREGEIPACLYQNASHATSFSGAAADDNKHDEMHINAHKQLVRDFFIQQQQALHTFHHLQHEQNSANESLLGMYDHTHTTANTNVEAYTQAHTRDETQAPGISYPGIADLPNFAQPLTETRTETHIHTHVDGDAPVDPSSTVTIKNEISNDITRGGELQQALELAQLMHAMNTMNSSNPIGLANLPSSNRIMPSMPTPSNVSRMLVEQQVMDMLSAQSPAVRGPVLIPHGHTIRENYMRDFHSQDDSKTTTHNDNKSESPTCVNQDNHDATSSLRSL